MSKPKAKQATLFQTWGAKTSSTERNVIAGPSTSGGEVINLSDDDEEDELLARAMEESLLEVEKGHHQVNPNTGNSSNILPRTLVGNLMQPTQHQSISKPIVIEDIPGFDTAAGRRWIYPTNYPVRDYQYNVVQQALFKNTLVVLPTGLGKTFIAAVVMYNFYCWYPQGKIVFMAPTKPLVAQQIEACYNIMGIPQSDTAEMTGQMQPSERVKAWQGRRVFFLTPQVLTNDLSRGACPAVEVKCLVVDEAHKALGNHAYCQVVRELEKYQHPFRVLALSATPGSDIKAVQKVLSNLLIAHIELRTEESADIKGYAHERKVEKIVVPLGAELTAVRTLYMQLVTLVVNRLKRAGVIYNRAPESLSKFLVLKARDQFRQDPPANLQRQQYGVIEGDFGLCMTLYHGYDLLQLHGLRSLQTFLEGIVSGEKGHGRTRTELMRNPDFNELMEKLQKKFEPMTASTQMTQGGSRVPKPMVVGHPKMEKLQEIVVDHFQTFAAKPNLVAGAPETRIMIFSQFRDSVCEITEMLNRHDPLVKAMSFIGQASTGKATKGFTQKEQLMVMKKFREGGYNTLISTCVGEEGLDIGDVDLIICFDAHKSPIRLVQRMGRTGRKREGKIVMLVTEGKEEQVYNQSQYSMRSIHKAILKSSKSLRLYENDARMVPKGLDPQPHKMHISVTQQYQVTGKNKLDSKVKKTLPSSSKTATAKGKKAARKDGYLTEAELQYWSDNYKVEEAEIPALPKSHFVTLTHASQHEEQEAERGKVLSLSEWTQWQNQKSFSLVSGHSDRTDALVEIMQFLELQGVVGDEEDNYGAEMRLYLNEDDVLKPGQSNEQGILKFCTTQQEKPTSKNAGKAKRKVRRSETLPGFSSDDNKDSDDDDLPAFGVGSVKSANSKRDGPFPEVIDLDDDTTTICDKSKKKQVLLKEEKSKPKKSKKVNKEGSSEESRLRRLKKEKKKKKAKRISDSFITVIADTDKDDFDGAIPSVPSTIVNDPGNPDVDLDLAEGQNHTGTSDEFPLTEIDMDENRKDNTPEPMETDDSLAQTKGKDPSESTSEVKSNTSCNTGTEIGTSLPLCRGAIVATPPSLDDIPSALEELEENPDALKKLDLIHLIDQWETGKEKSFPSKNGIKCFLSTPPDGDTSIVGKTSISVDAVRINTTSYDEQNVTGYKVPKPSELDSEVEKMDIDNISNERISSDPLLCERKQNPSILSVRDASDYAGGVDSEELPDLPVQVIPVDKEYTSPADNVQSLNSLPEHVVEGIEMNFEEFKDISEGVQTPRGVRTNDLPSKNSAQCLKGSGVDVGVGFERTLFGTPQLQQKPLFKESSERNSSRETRESPAREEKKNDDVSPKVGDERADEELSSCGDLDQFTDILADMDFSEDEEPENQDEHQREKNEVENCGLFNKSNGSKHEYQTNVSDAENHKSPKFKRTSEFTTARKVHENTSAGATSCGDNSSEVVEAHEEALQQNSEDLFDDTFGDISLGHIPFSQYDTDAKPGSEVLANKASDVDLEMGSLTPNVKDFPKASSTPHVVAPNAKSGPKSSIISHAVTPDLKGFPSASSTPHAVTPNAKSFPKASSTPHGIDNRGRGCAKDSLGAVKITPGGCGSSISSNNKTDSTLSSAHESFFDDDNDDLLLGACQTPCRISPPVKSQKLASNFSQHALQHDMSQVTFSQALSMVDRSAMSETGPITPIQSSVAIKCAKVMNNNSPSELPDSKNTSPDEVFQKQRKFHKSPQPRCAKSVTPIVESLPGKFESPTEVEEPQFDLGFSFDDLEDDDIIPPSPPSSTQPFSQRSNLSMLPVEKQKIESMEAKLTNIANSAIDQSLKRPLKTVNQYGTQDQEQTMEILPSTKTIPNPPTSSTSTGTRTLPPAAESMVISPAKKTTPIALPTSKTNLSLRNTNSKGDDRSASVVLDDFDDDDVDFDILPIDFDDDFGEDDDHQGKSLVEEVLVRNVPTAVVSPVVSQEIKDDDIQKQQPVSPSLAPVSDSDDSFVVVKKKKKSKPVLLSQESDVEGSTGGSGRDVSASPESPEFKTPIKPVRGVRSQAWKTSKAMLLSDDESPIIRRPRARGKAVIDTSFNEAPDDGDEDDFIDLSKAGRPRQNVSFAKDLPSRKRRHTSDESLKKTRKKKKSGRGGCAFIEGEAELSGDEGSTDESEDSDYDKMDGDFINDASQLSQEGPQDMRALYLKSVRSPSLSGGRFKLQYNARNDINVFSQAPPAEESQYMEDSFCVDDDANYTELVPEELSDEADEISMVDQSFHKGPRTRRQKERRQREKEVDIVEKKSKGRRRVVMMVDSSSEDDVKSPNHKMDVMEVSVMKKMDTKPSATNCDISNTGNIQDSRRNSKGIETKGGHVSKPVSQPSTQPSLLSRCKKLMGDKKNTTDDHEEPAAVFSLGFDDFDDEFDFSDVSHVSRQGKSNKAVLDILKPKQGDRLSTKLASKFNLDDGHQREPLKGVQKNTSISVPPGGHTRNYSASASDTSKEEQKHARNCTSGVSDLTPEEQKRQERLLRQKRLQEEFKRKMEEKKMTSLRGNESVKDITGSVQTKNRTSLGTSKAGVSSIPTEATSGHSLQEGSAKRSTRQDSHINKDSGTGLITSPSSKIREQGKPIIFIDSREINGTQELVSDLRLKLNVNAVVRQLSGCDYIVSNRMGVERKLLTDFSNGANRKKLIDRLRHMCELFDRPCLILEKERVKPGEEKAQRPFVRTKYVDTMFSYLSQMHIKVLFSESQVETAQLLVELSRQEERKNMGIKVKVELSPAADQVLKFYLSLPNVSYVTGLNFCQSFRSIQEFIKSPVQVVQMKGRLSAVRATQLHGYVRHKFDIQMMAAATK